MAREYEQKDLEEAFVVESSIETLDEVEVWVKSVVSRTDDPSIPAFTFRTCLLGILWSFFLAIANTVFSFRSNPFTVPQPLILLLAYPMGIFLASTLPDYKIFGFSLNPGPFSVKEHALIYIIAGSAGGLPYGTDNVVAQKFDLFIGDASINFWNSLPWILGTQFIGYGISGISRRYLVKPAAMMWPGVLPSVALLNSFHEPDPVQSVKYPMSRYTFFWLVFLVSFIYAWIPLYFAPAFAMVSLLCFFSNNRTLNFLGSSNSEEGAGIMSLTFDWSVIIAQSPLYTPFWAACNYFGGYIFWSWIITPLVFYMNPFSVPGGYASQSSSQWGGADVNRSSPTNDPYPDINNAHIFDKTGRVVHPTVASRMLNPDYTLNSTFYQVHKPFYLSPSFTIAYFCSFINITAVFTHVVLWYGPDVYRQFKQALKQAKNEDEDQYNVLMRAYTDVPDWFYLAFLAVFTAVQILSGMFTAYKMPWWSSVFAIVLGSAYVIPIGVIQAVSGFQMGLNVLTEFLIGLMTPGDTIGVMCFKSLGYNMVIQALNLSGDLKLGHYMHISPYYMFISQMIGTFLGAILNLATALWAEKGLAYQLVNVPAWRPNSYFVFTNAGAIWGAIGPARFFGVGSPYFVILIGFLIGAVLPIIPWFLNRVAPNPIWKQINIPLLVQQNQTGANQAFIVIPFALNIIFNKFIFQYRREWWEKYTFILGIALDSATSIALLIITAIQFIGPDYVNVGGGPFAPLGSTDYYCLEQSWNGSSLNA